MTQRERVLKALRREGTPDRMPFEISWGAFTPSLMEVFRKETGSTLSPEEYFDFDVRSVSILPTKIKTDFTSFYAEQLPENIVMEEWGYGAVPGSTEHFLEYSYHPLGGCESVAQVNAYPWPDVDAQYRFEGMGEKVAQLQGAGYAVCGELYQTIFETAWLMRGMEDLLMDFYLNPEIAHAICENIMDLRINQARQYAKAGVDILRLGDDVATQKGQLMSTELYREFLKERTRRIIQAAKEINPDILIFIHCDGKVEGLIEEFIDMGIEVLNPVQPECNDLEMIGRVYGDRLSFWGGVGTQSTMPFGTPEEVGQKVGEVQRLLGVKKGVLVAPSHILEPEIPWENVLAFINAAKNARY